MEVTKSTLTVLLASGAGLLTLLSLHAAWRRRHLAAATLLLLAIFVLAQLVLLWTWTSAL